MDKHDPSPMTTLGFFSLFLFCVFLYALFSLTFFLKEIERQRGKEVLFL